MKTLVVEDDITSRILIQRLLEPYGVTHVATTGNEAVEATRMALAEEGTYDLICMDIMMPELDGQGALMEIRRLEVEAGIPLGKGAKVIMTSSLHDNDNVMTAFREQCDAYLVKPVEKAQLLEKMRALGLID